MPLPRALGAAAFALALALGPVVPQEPAAAERSAGSVALRLRAVSGWSRSSPRPFRDAVPLSPQPHCGNPAAKDFPITSRLSGGPDAYERGGAQQTWELELRNTTDGECRAVHPVAVLSDKGRALQPGHIRLDFYDPGGARWRPVQFERTEEAENVGVLDGQEPDFPGFAVPARQAVTVRMRLGFTGDAPEGTVTANVTAVQRRGADGAWVGQSGDYAFAVGGGDAGADGLADTGGGPLRGIAAGAGGAFAAGAALMLVVRRRGAP
ncbi:hypothetical protein [Streptomyces sp. NPDC001404]|uniref:hypothetical protein n=1 Tax=Streptomyces sp. NPDC001404 TaxID=3364571 RepID=UPI0036914F14